MKSLHLFRPTKNYKPLIYFTLEPSLGAEQLRCPCSELAIVADLQCSLSFHATSAEHWEKKAQNP
jgi:hypothetical protein